MAEVENNWFRFWLGGEGPLARWEGDEDFAVDGADVAEAFDYWRAEYENARQVVARFESLDDVGAGQTKGAGILLAVLPLGSIDRFHQFVFCALDFGFLDGGGQRVCRFETGVEQPPNRAIARRVAPLAQPVSKSADRLAQVAIQQTDSILGVGNAPVQFIEDVIFQPPLPLAFSIRGKLAGLCQLDGFQNAQAGRPCFITFVIRRELSLVFWMTEISLLIANRRQLLSLAISKALCLHAFLTRRFFLAQNFLEAFSPLWEITAELPTTQGEFTIKDPNETSAEFDSTGFDIEAGGLNLIFC